MKSMILKWEMLTKIIIDITILAATDLTRRLVPHFGFRGKEYNQIYIAFFIASFAEKQDRLVRGCF